MNDHKKGSIIYKVKSKIVSNELSNTKYFILYFYEEDIYIFFINQRGITSDNKTLERKFSLPSSLI